MKAWAIRAALYQALLAITNRNSAHYNKIHNNQRNVSNSSSRQSALQAVNGRRKRKRTNPAESYDLARNQCYIARQTSHDGKILEL